MIRVGRRRLPSLLGIATIMASVLAAAQNAPDPAAASAPPKTLPKVVVSADQPEGYKADVSASLRTDTLLRDEPASVTVVTRKSIDDQNMQNLADVVRYVPGIGIAQGEGNRDNPVFRGSSSSSDLFIDGMRDDIEYYRDLYNIERVEALKGPNGMLFGRGGVGGVINRVSKQAGFDTFRSATLQGGSYSNGRVSLDLNQPFSDSVALRLNTMYENSDTYRDDVSLERYGINPTMTLRTSEDTRITFGAEYFHDERTADRGVSSFAGRPLETDPSEFFGDPAQSETHSTVKAISALFEHQFSDRLTLRNRTRYADYDKFYQNVYPGVVNAAGTDVQILAYNNAMQRDNLFNQTDLLFSLESGALKHSLLAGVELGRQVTDNFRNTGFFDTISPTTTSINVPLSDPRTTLPVSFRQSATDADNHVGAQFTDGLAHRAALKSPGIRHAPGRILRASRRVELQQEIHTEESTVRQRWRSFQRDVESWTRVVIFHDRFEDPLNQREIIGCQRLTPHDALVGLRELHQVFGPAIMCHFRPRLIAGKSDFMALGRHASGCWRTQNWWRRRESNPRPKALRYVTYMLSRFNYSRRTLPEGQGRRAASSSYV